jgi:hypothetical protein
MLGTLPSDFRILRFRWSLARRNFVPGFFLYIYENHHPPNSRRQPRPIIVPQELGRISIPLRSWRPAAAIRSFTHVPISSTRPHSNFEIARLEGGPQCRVRDDSAKSRPAKIDDTGDLSELI